MEVVNMSFSSLDSERKKFLLALQAGMPMDKVNPVYFKVENDVFAFITDYQMPEKNGRKFENEAPVDLYRGGAVIKVTCPHGVLVVPDERYGWFKPFAGYARFDEGHDLRLAGARELMEEAFIYNLKKTTRFVPRGYDGSKACSLDFTVDTIAEVGEVTLLDYAVNEKNKALEAVLQWDISGIEPDYSVSLEESWWAGGHNGISVFVINKQCQIVGIFSGQQGFQEIPKYDVHVTLKKYL
jgi:hypothetical protein